MKTLLAVFFLTALLARAALLPANDAFASRIDLRSANVNTFGSFNGATRESGEPVHGNVFTGKSIWWTWTAPANGVVSILAGVSAVPNVLAVYTGDRLSNLVAVAHDLSAATTYDSTVRLNVKAGVAYQIAVADFPYLSTPNSADDIYLRVNFTATATVANDFLSNSFVLDGIRTTGLGVNIGASKETGEPAHAGNAGGRSLWWTWTAPTDGVVTLSTRDSSTRDPSTGRNRTVDTLLAVYTERNGPFGTPSTVSALALLASNDNASEDSDYSEVKFNAVAGGRYAIAVDGFRSSSTGADSGNLVLHLGLERSNDKFSDRASILTSSALIAGFPNATATKESGETAHADNAGGKSVWWTWRAPAKGTVTLSTAGSNFDTLLAAYTGNSVRNLTALASSDDAAPAAQPPVRTSVVEFAVDSGKLYQIAVDGKAGASGLIALDLKFVADFPAIVTQPVNRSVTVGASATFAIVATGKPSPAYLWQRRVAGASTWTTISGETSASLVLNAVPQSANGDSFRCEVSNSLGKVVSAIVTLGVTPPPPVIALPATLRIRGAVVIPSAVVDAPANLRYYATSLPPGLTLNPITGVISGTITKAGSYSVSYWSQDGKVKSVVKTIVFVVLPLPDALFGSFESLLVAGDESVGLPAGKLTLNVTNAGSFTGTLATTDVKIFSFKGTVALNADFSAVTATVTLKRSAAESYTLALRVAGASVLSAQLGDLTGVKAATTGGVRLANYTAATGVAGYTATLRSELLDVADTRPRPLGAGYATGSIAKTGLLKLTGKLADGTKLTASLSRGPDGAYRLYAKPYKTAGNAVAGLLPLTVRADDAALFHIVTDDLYWTKPANAKDKTYAAGFGPLGLVFSMERWVKPALLGTALDLPLAGANHVFTVTLAEAGLSNAAPNARNLPTTLLLTSKNAVTLPTPPVTVPATPANPAAWNTKVNLATGVFTGSFKVQDPHPTTGKIVKRTIKIEGVLQQLPPDATDDDVFGRGFFLAAPVVKGDPTLSGNLEFAPPAHIAPTDS